MEIRICKHKCIYVFGTRKPNLMGYKNVKKMQYNFAGNPNIQKCTCSFVRTKMKYKNIKAPCDQSDARTTPTTKLHCIDNNYKGNNNSPTTTNKLTATSKKQDYYNNHNNTNESGSDNSNYHNHVTGPLHFEQRQ